MKPPSINLLVVDDDDVDRERLRRFASGMDLPVSLVEAHSVETAQAALLRDQFDCVLLDYHLGPNLGLCLLDDIKAHRREICPVILITLRESENVIVEAMQSGVTDYVNKATLDGERLNTTVHKALQAAARQQSVRESEERIRRTMDEMRAEHERTLRRALEDARSATEAKSLFCANVNHELRTPLNAIAGLAYLLERTELNPDQAALVGKIKVASKILLSTVNNVLDFSKIEAGEITPESAPFNLDELTSVIRELAEIQIGERPVAFVTDIAEDVPRELLGDSLRLRQVILNLVTNAIKFTQAGEVRMEVVVRSDDRCQTRRLRISIHDTGIGISETVIRRLFRPFVQADASTTRSFGGTGLGLSIAHELTNLMGGEIGAESEPGHGSVFWVDLPLTIPITEAVPQSLSEGAVHEHQRLSGVSILLVDDSDINLEVGKSILELEGAFVETASDGARAVSLVVPDPGRYNVVLMDMQMPIMDGFEAFRQIEWTLGPQRPRIIALTAGASSVSDNDNALGRMDGLVIKPFDVDLLVSTIARSIEVSIQPTATRAAPTAEQTAWPDLPGIDIAQVQARLSGNSTLFRSSVLRLLRENRDIETLLASTDQPDVLRRLHRLKGNTGLLSLTTAHDHVREAERALKGGEGKQAAKSILALAGEFRRLDEFFHTAEQAA